MLDDAISKTTCCQCGFKCLDKGSKHPACSAAASNNGTVLSVKDDTDANCRYRGLRGEENICACPTHYAIHHQHPYTNRTLRLSRENGSAQRPYPKDDKALPQTVAQAVQILVAELSLKDKLSIAHMNVDEIGESAHRLINYVQDTFALKSGNKELLWSCSNDAGREIEHPEDASAIILARLVVELVKIHKLSAAQ